MGKISKFHNHVQIIVVQVILLHADQFKESVNCAHLGSNCLTILEQLAIPCCKSESNEVINVAIVHQVAQVSIDFQWCEVPGALIHACLLETPHRHAWLHINGDESAMQG